MIYMITAEKYLKEKTRIVLNYTDFVKTMSGTGGVYFMRLVREGRMRIEN